MAWDSDQGWDNCVYMFAYGYLQKSEEPKHCFIVKLDLEWVQLSQLMALVEFETH